MDTHPQPYRFPLPDRRRSKPSDPESLFRTLNQRSPHIQHLWAHQADVLRSWHSQHINSSDIALELHTGTGKTLIGLLIGEFVRQTRGERVAYLCPNRQLANQVGTLASEYSIDARVSVGPQASYDANDFNAFDSSFALAVTTYSSVFITNPKINSANLLILDDAHASEDFIASLWNVDINRNEESNLYSSLLDFFKDVLPGSELWNLKNETTQYARSECTKIPSTVMYERAEQPRTFLDSTLEASQLQYQWQMIRNHLEACHVFVTWPSISIRPITPPTSSHLPFSNARQRVYMSATLGAGGELERITGVRKIERLPVPEGWDREGTGRRFILFPERSLPRDTAHTVAIAFAAEPTRSLVLAPNKHTAQSVTKALRNQSPRSAIFTANEIETSLTPFLEKDHAALVLHNRYDGIDLPGDACHLEWICGLPAATNAQEAFLLNRLGIHSLLRDRIRTRLTQALGRCTRNPTDYAVVILSGARSLDFCIRSENRSGFPPELQAAIQYGLEVSQVNWPEDFLRIARNFLQRAPGWEEVDEWIRETRDSFSKHNDSVALTLTGNVQDEIDYASALWVGDYQRALEKARACADRLSGDDLADYRAWWYYLSASVAVVFAAKENAEHLLATARELFERACAASPRSTWFREAARLANLGVVNQPIDDQLLLETSEAIERRLHEIGVAGSGFENEMAVMLEHLDDDESTSFEQGLERLGFWLGIETERPAGRGAPDGVWLFAREAAVAFEAKNEEQPTGSISLSTAREAHGHINWVKSKFDIDIPMRVSTVVVSDRTTVAPEALPNSGGLWVVDLTWIRQLGRKVADTIRAIRVEASGVSDQEFRRIIAERLKVERLDPQSIQSRLQGNPLADFPVSG